MDNKKFYNESSMENGFFERKFEILKNLVDKGSNVLDLGCYDGRVANFLTEEMDCIVDGADVSDININKDNKIINKYIFDLNEEKWPIEDKKYDYIIFTDVIEHIFDVDQFMLNVRKILKDDGFIVFSTPNLASLGRRVLLMAGKNPYVEISKHKEINLFNAPVVGHIRYFTLGNMKALATFYGFSVSRVEASSFTGGISIKFLEKMFPSLCWHIFIKARKIK